MNWPTFPEIACPKCQKNATGVIWGRSEQGLGPHCQNCVTLLSAEVAATTPGECDVCGREIPVGCYHEHRLPARSTTYCHWCERNTPTNYGCAHPGQCDKCGNPRGQRPPALNVAMGLTPDGKTTRRNALIEYLKSCVGVADWHGVSDAANDLRELEAEERGSKK